MSGWTICTLRGRGANNYEPARFPEDTDPWDSTADIAATMDKDDRVRRWTVWSSHVYAYLNTERGERAPAEAVIEDYADMARDGVLLIANNTTDTGSAYYYPTLDPPYCTSHFDERSNGAVGELALATINARHDIIARDPFHNRPGEIDDRYLEDGEVRL